MSVTRARSAALDRPLSLSDLDLILKMETMPGSWQDIFISAGSLGNVDLIYMPSLPGSGTGNFQLVVRGTTLADPVQGEEYALAVDYRTAPETAPETVPEPGTVVLLLFAVCSIGVIRWRHRAASLPRTRG